MTKEQVIKNLKVQSELWEQRKSETYIKGKFDEQERILEIIDIMRKDLNNPDYSYSNEWIENFLEELKAKIKGEKQ